MWVVSLKSEVSREEGSGDKGKGGRGDREGQREIYLCALGMGSGCTQP